MNSNSKPKMKYHNPQCKACQARRVKQIVRSKYYQANRERILVRAEKYREENEGKLGEASREYYQCNKDEILPRRKERYRIQVLEEEGRVVGEYGVDISKAIENLNKQKDGEEICPPLFIRLPRRGALCPWTGLSRPAIDRLIYAREWNNNKPPVASHSVKVSPKKSVRVVNLQNLFDYIIRQCGGDE